MTDRGAKERNRAGRGAKTNLRLSGRFIDALLPVPSKLVLGRATIARRRRARSEVHREERLEDDGSSRPRKADGQDVQNSRRLSRGTAKAPRDRARGIRVVDLAAARKRAHVSW
ncbi:hypothetical protein KM043_002639 [Ampulex compressa]|nr:hypothetical protein KM043_002639 [Ampulex compressa]